jgi:P27 family predicted phage terminase small subunit
MPGRSDSVRGRPPKPVEERVRDGTPGHRPLPEVLLVSGRPDLQELAEPPETLPREAKEFWHDVVLELVKIGMVDRVDRPVLKQLAVQYARIEQAQRVLAQDGHFTRGSVGQLKEHPALKIEANATALFLKLAEHYGLTPVARTRLGLAELHRRTLEQEFGSGLPTPDLKPIDEIILTDDDGDEIDQAIQDADVIT